MLSTSKSIWAFDPKTVPGCCLWLDGNDPAGTGAQPSPGAAVSSWVDKSGSNNSLTAAGTAPTFSNTSPGSITFGGAGYYSNASPVFSGTYTAFFVCKQTGGAGSGSPLFTTGATSGSNGLFLNEAGNTYFTRGDSTWYTGASPFASNVVNMACVSFSSNIVGGAESLYYAGSNVVSTTQANTITYTNLLLGTRQSGGTAYFVGSMYEVMGFNYVLSATQRQQIEGYLAAKWGIKSSLQSTHPFYTTPPFLKPFSPLDVPGCSLWLDAADRGTMNSATTVTVWNDKSGLGNTFTGSGTLSGSNMTFDGTGSQLFTCSSASPRVKGFSIFLVFSATNTEYFIPVVSGGGAGAPPSIWTLSTPATVSAGLSSVQIVELVPSTSAVSSALVSATWTGTTSSWFVNGTTASVFIDYALPSTGSIRSVGGASGVYPFTGTISELLTYNTVLTTNQRQRVEGYLARKWGLRSILDAAHPYKLIPPPTLTPLAAVSPGSCTLSSLTSTGGTITWGTSSTFADAYMWYVGTGSQTGILISGASMDPTVFTVTFTTTLAPGTTYYAWVVPYSAGGVGSVAVSAGVAVPAAAGVYFIASTSAVGYGGTMDPIPSFTAAPYSVIVVVVVAETDLSDTSVGATSVTGLGKTWTKKYDSGALPSVSFVYGSGTGCQKVQIYFAINNSASSVSGVITVNQAYFDTAGVVVASFGGCNLTNPWLTGGYVITAETVADFISPSMTLPAIPVANTLALSVWAGADGFITSIENTLGWTELAALGILGGNYGIGLTVCYNQFSTSQSAQTIGADPAAAYPLWIYMAAVLVPA